MTILIFGPPRSPGHGRDGPSGIQNTSTQCTWMQRIHIMHLGPLTDLYGTPGAPERARFGHKMPFRGPRRSSVGPGGPDLVPTSADWSAWAGLMVAIHFGLLSGLYWAPGGSKRARFAQKSPLLDQIGPLAATKRPNINPKFVVTMSPTHVDQSAAVGTKSGPLMISGDSKRGILGQKGPFLGPRQGPIPAQSVL